MHRLRVLTNSELKAKRRCDFEHHVAYELGYRSAREEAEALRFGTLIHAALEAWWRTRGNDRLVAALAALQTTDSGDALDLHTLARAVEMVIGYHYRWGAAALEPLAVEAEFRGVPLGTRFELAGKLDALALNHEDGRVYIVEHKTSSDDLAPGSVYWQCLQLDTQISTYYHGARALGYEPAGVIYDVLAKPKHRPLQATPIEARKYTRAGELYATQRLEDESPEAYGLRIRNAIADEPDRFYGRGVVVRLEDEEVRAQRDALVYSHRILESERMQAWPRNPDACRRFGRLCSYFPVCTGTALLDDTSLYRRAERAHEELSK